jgi:hypothetical protein
MLLIMTVAFVTIVSLAITFFLTDRSHWRKFLLVIGIAGAALSSLQAYNNRERAAGLQNDLGALQQKLEREQATHLPRTITPEQQAKLIERLTPTGKGPVIMNVAVLDATDAKPFAAQISEVLTKSGFTISSPEADTLSFSLPGAWLVVNDINNAPLHAKAIQDAFKEEAEILLVGYSKPEMVKDINTVMICVSSHPP